ncbi:MAG: class I SAM-dependent methyltransferase [Chloroflexi bacterium]|nr:class I SAM-dependent methyltransferase [Chloroflexota bacterium]
MKTDSTQLFSNRADNYAKYRPSYPQAVLECLRTECGLTPTHVVADVGSGTGILSELFLKNGNPVFSVEPNDEMRKAAERLLSHYPNLNSVNSTAEATTLPDNSVDFVTAGQALHWFDRPKAKIEFERILRPESHAMFVWNAFDFDGSPFMGAYERLFAKHSGQQHRADWGKRAQDIALFFDGRMNIHLFDNPRNLDFAAFKGGYLSSSHAPQAGHPQHEPLLRDLGELFDNYQKDGLVRFLNITRMYFGPME